MTVEDRTSGLRPDDGTAERLASYASVARLAPSKHNSQPWRFVVHGDALEVWRDTTRALPATDPLGREAVLACGAAVETACVAAAAVGERLAVAVWPDGASGPVARLREGERVHATEHDRALLAAVSRRRTDRGPLDASALPPSLPFLLQDVVAQRGCVLRLLRTGGDARTFAHVVEVADRQLSRRPDVVEELETWTREPHDPRTDGVSAGAARGPRASYTAPFVQRDFSRPDVTPSHDRAGVDAPLVGVLCTPRDAPPDWVHAGRALMAVLLEVTVAGGSASYLDQPIELPHTRELLVTDLQLPGPPQVALRIGVGGHVAPTPRRPAEEVVVRTP